MIQTIIFDIETGPLPEEQLRAQMPEFTAPGNYKDPDKIKANVAEQQQKWLTDGALSAVTGEVLVIGRLEGDGFSYHCGADEKTILETWWQDVRCVLGPGNILAGFCCKTFDLPFLIRRSWLHGVKIPLGVFEGRYFSRNIEDIAELWGCGSRDPRDRISLDNLSKFLGIGQKNGDGKDFSVLWKTDRAKALEYLHNDLKLTKAAYDRMNPRTP